MARKDERGTGDDPAWQGDDLTGGNDSGTAEGDFDRGEEPTGPDLTGVLMDRSRGSVAGTEGPASHRQTERHDAPSPDPARGSQAPADEVVPGSRDLEDDEPEPGVNEWGP